MLVRFTVDNYLSFNHPTTLNMTKGNNEGAKSDHIIKVRLKPKTNIDLLKSASIYGANAAGKSNLVKSIKFARDLILSGIDADDEIKLNKFRLDERANERPSTFIFDFVLNDQLFSYGFSIQPDTVLEEYLYLIKSKKELVFKREVIEGNNEYKLGNHFKDQKEFIGNLIESTRANNLVLSELLDKNPSSFKRENLILKAADWFHNALVIIEPDSDIKSELGVHREKLFSPHNYYRLLADIFMEDETRIELAQLLAKFDTGISAINLKKIPNLPLDRVEDKEIKELLSYFSKESKAIHSAAMFTIGEDKFIVKKKKDGPIESFVDEFITQHKMGSSGNLSDFELNEESDGTQRMFNLIPILQAVKRGRFVFIVDELERSLHPNNARLFTQMFFEKSVNTENQLIFTTHNLELLDDSIFRTDELWIAEKNQSGETELYSFDEFENIRKDKLKDDYLMGRYGGIPKNTHYLTKKI